MEDGLKIAQNGCCYGCRCGTDYGILVRKLQHSPVRPTSSTAFLSSEIHLRMHRGGAGPRGVLPTLSQYMLGSAATFSFFLAIGSVCWTPPCPPASEAHHDIQVIRNDGQLPAHLEAARMQLASPIMRSRSEGLASMRAQWVQERTQRSGPQ